MGSLTAIFEDLIYIALAIYQSVKYLCMVVVYLTVVTFNLHNQLYKLLMGINHGVRNKSQIFLNKIIGNPVFKTQLGWGLLESKNHVFKTQLGWKFLESKNSVFHVTCHVLAGMVF